MPLNIVATADETLVSPLVKESLRAALDASGSATLLVPSFAQALDAQRVLSREPGLALSVTVTTLAAWVKERWEVWGDGRAIADSTVLSVLSYLTLRDAPPEVRGPLELSRGLVKVMTQLAGRALPWLPLDGAGNVDEGFCTTCGLTHAETCLIGVVGSLRELLHERGYVTNAEAYAMVPQSLATAGANVPPVVIAGFSAMARHERELVSALAGLTQVTFVAYVCDGPASGQARSLIGALGGQVPEVIAASANDMPARAEGLRALMSALFTGERIQIPGDGSVELLHATGPVAEAELVAGHVAQLLVDRPQERVVIATPDVARARRELLPKLAARGVPARMQWSTALADCPSEQAFFAFAHAVAHLVELDQTWPGPAMGLEGPMIQLGDMSWWPPRDLSDFLLSQVSHLDPARAWRLDAQWRGNRILTPARVLETLQSEREVGDCVAHATAELLRGRVGTAASKLLLPIAERMGEGIALDDATDEARAVLQGILQLAGTLHELGVTADPTKPGAVSLPQLVELMEWAAEGMSVRSRVGTVGREGMAEVSVMGPRGASQLGPASADVVIACGLTTAESPIKASDDLLSALLELLGVEPHADPMTEARASFRALTAVPTCALVLERALHDADSKLTYPSVMLAELLSCYEPESSAGPGGPALPTALRLETDLAGNLAPAGTVPTAVEANEPAPAGQLTERSRGLVFVPQDGSVPKKDDKPVLSASQVETYLDCPYKWFSLRRLRLGTVDAGYGGMEMGTFAHRVLEVTHRELLVRALERQRPGISREELLAQIEADPSCHVPGSRVDASNLEDARIALELEFDLHRQHLRMIKRPRAQQQVLVPHDAHEEELEEKLKTDLVSALGFETRILQGFEPRLFEWGFGRHGNLVEYAGAYFTGTVDRIDVSPHGTAVIIDYKHKSPNGFAAEYDALQEGVLAGDALPNRVQSLIYAQVVRRAFEGRLNLVGTVYLSTKSPHALAGAADENVVDLVFGKISSVRAPRVCVPRESGGSSGMAALLDRTEELVAEQVAQMMAGNVEANPRDKRSCDFCPVMQCDRRVAR